MTNRVTRDIDIVTTSEEISPKQQIPLTIGSPNSNSSLEVKIAFVDLDKEEDGSGELGDQFNSLDNFTERFDN